MEFKQLRKKYPCFVYENYSYNLSGKNLIVVFDFRIEPGIEFSSKLTIQGIDKKKFSRIDKNVLDNLVFNLGLIESLSYWKSTCSPKIQVNAGYLSKEQTSWWRDLIINGMGQFFYENRIDFRPKDFVEIRASGKKETAKHAGPKNKKVLVPIGGGKDSIVTLELLNRSKKQIGCFSLNPISAAQRVMKMGGCKDAIIIKRTIDKNLLQLNKKGFLNGHTPFSAYLAFLSILLAALFDYQYIALSNERSSNEGNVRYLGKTINHQYSKSFDFEKKFRNYSKKYLSDNIEYFSFLRPLYEIQISGLFSNFTEYFPVFLSCNESQKTHSGKTKPGQKWCSVCPKCLFVFMSLYPFVEKKQLIKIFGENLFENRKLLPLLKELIGEIKFKPFECVGTQKESLAALYLGWKKEDKKEMPYLLKYFEERIMPKHKDVAADSLKIMESWNKQHKIPRGF